MLGPGRSPGPGTSWAMSAAMLGAWTMAQLRDELQIDFEVALFNRGFAARVDDTEETYRKARSAATAGRRRSQGAAADRLISTVNHYLVRPCGRRSRDAEPAPTGPLFASAQTTRSATHARRSLATAPPAPPIT